MPWYCTSVHNKIYFEYLKYTYITRAFLIMCDSHINASRRNFLAFPQLTVCEIIFLQNLYLEHITYIKNKFYPTYLLKKLGTFSSFGTNAIDSVMLLFFFSRSDLPSLEAFPSDFVLSMFSLTATTML